MSMDFHSLVYVLILGYRVRDFICARPLCPLDASLRPVFMDRCVSLIHTLHILQPCTHITIHTCTHSANDGEKPEATSYSAWHFLTIFLVIAAVAVTSYVCVHNRKKVSENSLPLFPGLCTDVVFAAACEMYDGDTTTVLLAWPSLI